MKIKVNIDSKVVKRADGSINSIKPVISADIDVNIEEMKFLRKNDTELYARLNNMIGHVSGEIARQVQVS